MVTKRGLRGLSAVVWLLASCVPDPGPQAYFGRALDAYQKNHFSQAARDFQMLADTGDAISQLYLARMHVNGEGFPVDYNQAVHWYLLAADGGVAEAQNELAYLYLYGTGVARDPVESTYWFERAANQGMTEAQLSLAEILGTRNATPKQLIEAYRWYTIASRQVGARAKQNIINDRNKLLEYMSVKDVEDAERLAYQWIPSIERK